MTQKALKTPKKAQRCPFDSKWKRTQKVQKARKVPKAKEKGLKLLKRPKVVKNRLKGPMLLRSSQDCLRWPKRAQILASQYMAENMFATFFNTCMTKTFVNIIDKISYK